GASVCVLRKFFRNCCCRRHRNLRRAYWSRIWSAPGTLIYGGPDPGIRLSAFCGAEEAVGPPTGYAQCCQQGQQQQDSPSSRLWLLGLKKRIQARESLFPQRVHAGLICGGFIQAQHRGRADGRYLLVCGKGCVLRDSGPGWFRRIGYRFIGYPCVGYPCIGYLGEVRYWRARRPPGFKQVATHSAETEIVRIVLAALRADHRVLRISFRQSNFTV